MTNSTNSALNVNFSEMSLKEMALWFGVTRFADRTAAVKRCTAKLEEMVAAEAARLAAEAAKAKPVVAKAHRTAAEGIAESWTRQDVRERRLTRNAVACNGMEFNSVPAAFLTLGLPMNKMIKFRMALKEEGFKTFSHEGKEYKFVIAG